MYRIRVHVKSKAIPITCMDRPVGFPDFKTRTGRLYHRKYSWLEAESTGRVMSVKYSNDTVGNRTLDIPTCSPVSQPTASPRAVDARKVML
jgi:hypothetical protein